jgi:hypothetical protein
MLLAGLVLAAGLSLGSVVVVATLVVWVVVGPADPAPRVETWLSVLVEAPVVALVMVVGAGLVPVVVGAATRAVVVGPAPPPLLAINGMTMAAATTTAPATAMPTTRERRGRALVRATSWDEWRGW